MPASYNNWVYEKGNVREKDIIELEKAKKRERRDGKNGYRWIKINERNKLFIPCDKDGNPTERGQRMISNFKIYMGIK